MVPLSVYVVSHCLLSVCYKNFNCILCFDGLNFLCEIFITAFVKVLCNVKTQMYTLIWTSYRNNFVGSWDLFSCTIRFNRSIYLFLKCLVSQALVFWNFCCKFPFLPGKTKLCLANSCLFSLLTIFSQ